METEKHLLVTLRCGKVYVGRITSKIIPGQRESTFQIYPMHSGYRDKEKQNLRFETDYESAYRQIMMEQVQTIDDIDTLDTTILRDFRIVIPMAEVNSATYFDMENYQKFFDNAD
jgi:hypothetical protein